MDSSVAPPRFLPVSLFAGSDLVDADTLARRALMDRMLRPEQFRLHGKGRGRPAWPVGIMLRIVYLQKDEGCGDRRLVQRLHHDRRLRFLAGLPPFGRTPSRSALVDFRRYLLEADALRLAMEQQAAFIATTPVFQAEPLEAIIDSTPQSTAAAQPTVIGLLQHACRRVLLAWRRTEPQAAVAAAGRLRVEVLLAKRFNRISCSVRKPQGRRLWGRWVRKAKAILQAVPPAPTGVLADAVNLLRRVLDERGKDGTATPPDRITNAMDAHARFGCKGEGSHRITWQGYKVTVVTHAATDLILTAHVMSADHVDGDALVPAVDALKPIFGRPVRLDADGAYTDRTRRESMADRDVLLIGPRRTARKRGRVPGGGRVASRADRGRRSGVEKVHAHLVRWRGNRRSPYLGLRKAWLQTVFAVCAANLARLLTLWRQGRLPIAGLAQPA